MEFRLERGKSEKEMEEAMTHIKETLNGSATGGFRYRAKVVGDELIINAEAI